MATLLARLTKYKMRHVQSGFAMLRLGSLRRMSNIHSLRCRKVKMTSRRSSPSLLLKSNSIQSRPTHTCSTRTLTPWTRSNGLIANGSVASTILGMKRFNSGGHGHGGQGGHGGGKPAHGGHGKPNKPWKNQYLSLCSNFRYPPELGTKENYRQAFEFVKKYLNKTKSVSDITSPSLLRLKDMCDNDPIIRMLLSRQIEDASRLGRIDGNLNISWFLCRLNDILSYSPICNNDSPADSVTLPLAILYGPLADTEAGEALSLNDDMNKFWKDYLTEWYNFLSSRESAYVLNSEDGWLGEKGYDYMNMDSFIIPENGYKSWNEFFYRFLKDGQRPITSPNDNTIITSAVDAQVWRYYENMKEDACFWIKSQPYHPTTLLNHNSEHAERYEGGNAFQCVLWTEDYHRWHAPVSGRVKSVTHVQGTYFTNTPFTSDDDTTPLKSYTGSFTYMGHLNTRMVIEIDSSVDINGDANGDGNVGTVTFIAVGLQDVSTCTQSVFTGDYVNKGDELGYFQFGGSTCIYLFPKGTINSMNVTIPDDPFTETIKVKMGEQIATANLQN